MSIEHSAEYRLGYTSANERMVDIDCAKTLRLYAEIFFDRDDYYRGYIAACDEENEIQRQLDVEWERINKLTPEELNAELLASGYTQERPDSGLARLKDTLAKHSVPTPKEVSDVVDKNLFDLL